MTDDLTAFRQRKFAEYLAKLAWRRYRRLTGEDYWKHQPHHKQQRLIQKALRVLEKR